MGSYPACFTLSWQAPRGGEWNLAAKLARINHQLRRETQRRRETPCWAGWSKAGAGLWKGCMRTYRPHHNPGPTPLQPASRKSQQMAGDFSGLVLIGVGMEHGFAPCLPPNRTCGFPASGSPVSGLLLVGDPRFPTCLQNKLGSGGAQNVPSRDFRYVRHPGGIEEQLYDHRPDPAERENVIDQPRYEQQAERMQAHLERLIAEP